MLRIPIREQLAALLLLASLIALAILSVATWVTNYNLVTAARSTRLTIAASLKASQLASNIALMENSCQFIASRIKLQDALAAYNLNGSNSAANWAPVIPDMDAAITGPVSGGAVGQSLLLQSQIFPMNANGPAGGLSLINNTNLYAYGKVKLPYTYPNGSSVFLGDAGLGFPPNMYPNFTYTTITTESGEQVAAAEYQGSVLSPERSPALLIGPWQVNETFAILSISIAIVNNTSSSDVLGWLSVLMDARLIQSVIEMPQGLDKTGEMLVVRPTNATNQYPPGVVYDSGPNPSIYNDQPVQFILPLSKNASSRHPGQTLGASDPPFKLSNYPAALTAVTKDNNADNNAGAFIKTTNEANRTIAAGFALVDVPFVDWAVLVEEERSEVLSSTVQLKKVILACVFGTLALMAIIAWPLAHFSSRPIRELKAATMKSVQPPGFNDSSSTLDYTSDFDDENRTDGAADRQVAKKEGFFTSIIRRRKRSRTDRTEEARRREFRIPGRVRERKHLVNDELSELTHTYNEMSDELMMQYERLEERVRSRTAELELSKKAAEAANESKTLFIANISHELKTPLNGILGMCAVCMQEDDPIRLKRSLGIIYKSGDLLLNLLTDLLTFSKNQVGQQLSLDEKEFRLRDISSQVQAIFEKQAKDGQIELRIRFQRGEEPESTDAATDEVAGNRVKDMILWGDTHRILQVVINLLSNSLKFTPPGGSVTLVVKCLGEAADLGSRKPSLGSKTSRARSNRNRNSDISHILGRNSASQDSSHHVGGSFARLMDMDRATPPPGKMMNFEFEVIDTGPGIPENIHQSIFEPFVQGDLGLSKKYGGTGLGLSICSQLAGLMHGHMSLKSEVGQGSAFSMRIPLRHLLSRADSTASSSVSQNGDAASIASGNDVFGSPNRRSIYADNTSTSSFPDANAQAPASPVPTDHYSESAQPRLVGLSQPFFASSQPMESPGSQPAAIESIKAAASSGGRIRVLVAEDNKVNQEVVLRMLKLEDIYDVTVAKDGQEALDMVKASMSPPSSPFNLIFMDVQMPNLDGLQSTKLIRETGFDAPIVALTAFAEESNVKDCLESGMNYFLSKPIRRPALKKVLNQYCSTIQEVDEETVTTPTEKRSLEKEVKSPTGTLDGSSVRKPSTIEAVEGNVYQAPATTVVVVSRPTSMEGTKSLETSPVKPQ